MTDITSRNRGNKDRGSRHERDTLAYLLERGLAAARLVKTGRQDEGDLAVTLTDPAYGVIALVLEAKNEKSINLGGYMSEATVEAEHYRLHREGTANQVDASYPIAVVKRRQHATDRSYAVLELGTLIDLLLHVSRR